MNRVPWRGIVDQSLFERSCSLRLSEISYAGIVRVRRYRGRAGSYVDYFRRKKRVHVVVGERSKDPARDRYG